MNSISVSVNYWQQLVRVAVVTSSTALFLLGAYRWFKQQVPEMQLPAGIQIHVINSASECDQILAPLLAQRAADQSGVQCFGFDIEWKPNTGSQHHKVALIQLSTKHSALKQLLEDPKRIKSGVAVLSDARMLFRDHGIVVRGALELQSICARFKYTHGGNSLSALCRVVLGRHLRKDHHIRCSNWEAHTLSEQQKTYASLDAVVGYMITRTLIQRHCSGGTGDALLQQLNEFIDTRAAAIVRKPRLGADSAFQARKSNRGGALSARKSLLYHNCRIYSPDGTLLCTCDRKKIDWYISRQLADVVSNEPLSIKLKFAPSGSGKAGDEYYLAKKTNACVVCGAEQEVCKHSIVPHQYRTWGVRSNALSWTHKGANKSRTKIAFHAPLMGSGPKLIVDLQLEKYKAAARALLRTGPVPAERVEELRNSLASFFGHRDFTEAQLRALVAQSSKIINAAYKSHGQMVVAHLQSKEKLVDFIKGWRYHFLRAMQPKFLSPLWSPEHSIDE